MMIIHCHINYLICPLSHFDHFRFCLGHKAKVISIDDEPVKIKDQHGNMIRVPGSVKFDSGNNAGTAISDRLVDNLGLKPDYSKMKHVTGAGGTVLRCSMVKITVIIRKRICTCHALVGVPAPGTDLLIGMDIIERLNDEGYTLGK